MSIQPPPTNTTTPVYNPIFYVNPTSSSGIDVAFLDANYLKFPTAQGSEDFTNGLFSTDTIDFNSSTGANRAITNVSKTEFSDILGNTLYTSSIEENSTAIGIYDGGLLINSSNSINLVGTNILANGTPIGVGSGNVSDNQNNTFQNGFTQTFDGAISIDNLQSNIGQLSSNNTGLGGGVFSNLTSGGDNSIFGYHSALGLTTGGQNVSIGRSSLASLTTGQGNTALGWESLNLLVSSNYNTAIGNLSAYSLTSGNQNTSIGYQTGGYMTTGSNNVSIGYLSGVSPSAPTLSDTIAIGKGVSSVATGDIILGFTNFTPPNDYWAKFTPNTTFGGVQLQGTYNNSGNITISAVNQSVALEGTFIDLNGTGSGLTSGVNVSNGININAGVVQTTDKASNPTFQSLYSCYYSLSGVPYFGYNNAGTYTYSQLATTSNVGQYTNYNTGIGFEIFPSFTTGEYNSAFGYQSLNSLTTGTSNTSVGYQSLATLISGDLNTTVGWGSLAQNILDNKNVAIGYASGFNLVGNGTNSDLNTFVGWNSGINQTSGSNNIAIGQYSGVDTSTPTISNTIAIGNITTTAPLDIILGSSNSNYVKFNCSSSNYELSAYNLNSGITNTDLYVNGFAQQPSNSTPTYLPTSYGTFYNNGGLPYFAYNNSGTITNSSLATVSTFSYTSGNGVTTVSPVGTIWTLSIPIQTAISPYQSPLWGKIFRWSAYTKYNQGSYDLNNAQVEIQGQFQLITGTGVYQPTFYSGSPVFYSYVFSTSVNSISGSSGENIGFNKNEMINGVNTIQFFSNSNAGVLTTFPMELVIETIQ